MIHHSSTHYSGTSTAHSSPLMATRWTSAAGQKYDFVKRFSHYLIRYATWLPPFIWFNQYVAEVTFINGPSMYPFLNSNYNESTKRDLCLVWKVNAQQDLKRGEVVVFRYLLSHRHSSVEISSTLIREIGARQIQTGSQSRESLHSRETR